MTAKKVLIAMSGGVDSSVSAALLKEQGYDCIGVTMQLWDYSKNVSSCNPNDKFDTCCSLDDVADARLVAHKLGIPFYVFNYEDNFKTNVVDYFVKEYLSGQTPNPCVACNTFLKFDLLFERAKALGCDYIATGHYAKIFYDSDAAQYKLLCGEDRNKDQSYFLYSMNQDVLKKTLFPVGHLTKKEVREIAQKYDLINAQKKESMEICFIPNNDYAEFVRKNSSENEIIKGKVFHENGRFIADHEGIHQFTVGQRKGLGFATGEKVYVTRIERETGNVYVGDEVYLFRKGFKFKEFRTVYPDGQTLYSDLTVKIRYRARNMPMILKKIDDHYECIFIEPQKSVTPGQIAVVYHQNEVVGGGFIYESF